MRVFTAGVWTMLIYTASVIRLKKRAWSGGENIVPVLIHSQILFDKRSRTDLQEGGGPLNITFIEDGAGGLTTVSASKTIGSGEDLIVKPGRDLIQVTRYILFQFLNELFIYHSVLRSDDSYFLSQRHSGVLERGFERFFMAVCHVELILRRVRGFQKTSAKYIRIDLSVCFYLTRADPPVNK